MDSKSINIRKNIFSIRNAFDFSKLALQIFQYQYQNNEVYREYCDHLKINVKQVESIEKIPFLPVEFFKTREVTSCSGPYEKIFTSSGTTGAITSKHFVKDLSLYEYAYKKAFKQFYGDIGEYCILALLPSYLEREGSSLVEMSKGLMDESHHTDNGFYLNDYDKLGDTLKKLEDQKQKTILIGVTFALLDFAEKHPMKLSHTVIMETGGMKGRRKEMTREEVHTKLKESFYISNVHSEYGMTELLSQAYSKGDGKYFCPPWMKIMIRDQFDPFNHLDLGKTGGINIIDLANADSCAFIETKDLGKTYRDGGFEVIGRFDNSDIRGCNLMVS